MKNSIIKINKIITQRQVRCMATGKKIASKKTCIRVDFQQGIIFPEVTEKNLILSWHFLNTEIFNKWFKKTRQIALQTTIWKFPDGLNSKKVISTKELAKMFNVKSSTISWLRRMGRLSGGLRGFEGEYYYPKEEAINKMKNRRKSQNTSDLFSIWCLAIIWSFSL